MAPFPGDRPAATCGGLTAQEHFPPGRGRVLFSLDSARTLVVDLPPLPAVLLPELSATASQAALSTQPCFRSRSSLIAKEGSRGPFLIGFTGLPLFPRHPAAAGLTVGGMAFEDLMTGQLGSSTLSSQSSARGPPESA